MQDIVRVDLAERRYDIVIGPGVIGEAGARIVPLIGRRVDYIHRHYNRDWREVPGVVLWGEKHFTIDEDEFRMLRAIDGRQTVGAISASFNGNSDRTAILTKVRRLARRGVIDLIPASH